MPNQEKHNFSHFDKAPSISHLATPCFAPGFGIVDKWNNSVDGHFNVQHGTYRSPKKVAHQRDIAEYSCLIVWLVWHDPRFVSRSPVMDMLFHDSFAMI